MMAPKKNSGALILVLVQCALVALAVISGWNFYSEYKPLSTAQHFYEAVRPKAAATQDTEQEAGVQIDFDSLKKLNADVVAWLSCPDTPIDYPVLQADNNDYYLRHLMDGSYNAVGSVFMDYQNAFDFTGANTVLYGHHIKKDDAMFATLINYEEQTYYEAHPVLLLYTPQGDYTVELFAGYLAAAQTVLPHQFENGAQQQAFVRAAIEQSDFKADITVGENDRLITMVTCAYNFTDARYLLFGRLTAM